MGPIQKPFWLPNEHTSSYPTLDGDIESDIVVIGGSFTGLTAAFCLAKAGHKVCVVEASTVGLAASRSAGILCSSLERDFLDYQNTLGKETAARLWKFSVEGVSFIKQLIKKYDPDNRSQLETGGSLYTSFPEDTAYLRQEAEGRQEAGFTAQFFENQANPFYEDGAILGIYTPEDATINPYRFCRMLANLAQNYGVTIYENSKVRQLDRSKKTCLTGGGSIRGNKLLLAGQPIPGQFGYSRRELDILTFCLTTAPLTNAQISLLGLANRASFWDADQPFFYGRLTPDNRLLLGGDDLWKPMSWLGLQNIKLDRLERRARERIPLLEDISIEYRWDGALTILSDAMPSVGVRSDIFIGGNAAGISQAVMVGKILAGLVVDCQRRVTPILDYKRPLDLIPKMYSSKELFHMLLSLVGIW